MAKLLAHFLNVANRRYPQLTARKCVQQHTNNVTMPRWNSSIESPFCEILSKYDTGKSIHDSTKESDKILCLHIIKNYWTGKVRNKLI